MGTLTSMLTATESPELLSVRELRISGTEPLRIWVLPRAYHVSSTEDIILSGSIGRLRSRINDLLLTRISSELRCRFKLMRLEGLDGARS